MEVMYYDFIQNWEELMERRPQRLRMPEQREGNAL